MEQNSVKHGCTVEELLNVFIKMKGQILNRFGTVRPMMPVTQAVIDYRKGLKKWVKIHRCKRVINKIVLYVCLIESVRTYHSNLCIEQCLKCPFLIHNFRLLSYILHITKINRSIKRDTKSLLHQITDLCLKRIYCIIQHVVFDKDKTPTKRYINSCTRLTKQVYNPKFKGAMKQYHHLSKKVDNNSSLLGRRVNDFVTEKWKNSDHRNSVVHKSNRNLVLMSSIHLLVIYYLTFLPVYVIEDMYNYLEKNAVCKTIDSDIIYMQTMMIEHIRARMNIKYVEVNIPLCTCMAKCYGLVGNNPKLQSMQEDTVDKNNRKIICGVCRLAPSIENTNTTKKSRREIPARNTTYDRCTGCGMSIYKCVRMYVCDIQRGKDNNIRHRFSARFYTTSSRRITNEIEGKGEKTPSAKYQGMCMGGDRRCYRLIQVKMKSMRKDVSKIKIANISSWSRCLQCSKRDNIDSFISTVSMINDDYTNNTCIAKFLADNSKNVTVDEICNPCLLAANCFHMDKYICGKLACKNETKQYYWRYRQMLNKILIIRTHFLTKDYR